MKKHYRIKFLILATVVLFCILYTGYKAFFYFDGIAEQKEIKRNEGISRLTEKELSQIAEGDIILRRGFGFFSDYIAKNLNDTLIDVTHAGIIVNRDGALHVIHSLSSDVSPIDGLQIQPIGEFLKHSEPGKIMVTRIKNSNSDTASNIAKLAQGYLEQHVPFDHNGDFDDGSKLFCTELIWRILEKDLHHTLIPLEITARKDFFYSMAPMYDTRYFDIVINQYSH
ncbi:MAG: hypothetical protein EOO45_10865 [Flavobacterium sp.]|nr:MAG: hypothetical protein EOO45_10865 [Flavobacterium sp.]